MKFISKKVLLKNVAAPVSGAVLVLTVLLSGLSGVATAAEPIQCKGLQNSACLTANSCSWVEGYERKDGRKVNAFCRTKAKSKSTSAAPAKTNNKAS